MLSDEYVFGMSDEKYGDHAKEAGCGSASYLYLYLLVSAYYS